MDRHVFVVLRHDYADEFDVTGCAAMYEADWNEIYAKIERGFDQRLLNDCEFYFGTNEALMFGDFADFSRGCSVEVCTKAFHDEFNALNNNGPVGYWVVEQLLERIAEGDDFGEGDE